MIFNINLQIDQLYNYKLVNNLIKEQILAVICHIIKGQILAVICHVDGVCVCKSL